MITTRETRHEAYIEMSGKREARHALILDILGSRQMTASEITEALLARGVIRYYDRNFVAPRLTELKQIGAVTTVGKRLCPRTGRNVAVWAKKEA